MSPHIRLHSGILNGESGEYVYDADGSASGIKGYKISELNWQLNSVPMVGVGFTFTPADKFRVNLDYWKNAADGDGTMDDYDWLYVGYDWSHWSHHGDTTVRDVTRMSASLDYELYTIDSGDTQYFAELGYRSDHLDWQSRGGHGIYSISSYRDSYVSFPDIPGISYEQTFTTPYVGLSFASTGNADGMDVTLSGAVRYSQWVHGEDVDIHHLRDLRFEEEGDDGEWLGLELGLDFEIDSQWSVLLNYSYQRYDEIKATTTVIDLNTGARTFYPGDAAGLDHSSFMFSLGVDYSF